MSLSLSSALVFVGVVTALGSIYSLLTDFFFGDRAVAHARVDAEFRKKQRQTVEESTLFKDFQQLLKAASGEQAAQRSWEERLQLWLNQTGMIISTSTFLCLMLGGAVLTGVLGYCAQQNLLVAGVGAAVGLVLPWLFVRYKRNARQEKLRSQLTEAFETIARSMRCGLSLIQSLNIVATECERPIAEEFSLCFEQQKLGLPADVAYRDMADRIGLLEMRLFSLAALIQSKTGGTMGDLVGRLAEMVRERYRTRLKVRTLTAESRLQANVLLAIPVVVFCILLAIKRDYAQALLDNPTLLGMTLGLQVLGILWIKRIVRLDG